MKLLTRLWWKWKFWATSSLDEPLSKQWLADHAYREGKRGWSV